MVTVKNLMLMRRATASV